VPVLLNTKAKTEILKVESRNSHQDKSRNMKFGKQLKSKIEIGKAESRNSHQDKSRNLESS
jgi:hypothetical protein